MGTIKLQIDGKFFVVGCQSEYKLKKIAPSGVWENKKGQRLDWPLG
jgi:hypothetical protein